MTIDLDFKNPLKMCVVIIKGILINRKIPSIRETRKGYHLIWRGLKIPEREMFKRRMVIGDDRNRIRLDMASPKRINQVLFCEKRVVYYDKGGSIEREIVSRNAKHLP